MSNFDYLGADLTAEGGGGRKREKQKPGVIERLEALAALRKIGVGPSDSDVFALIDIAKAAQEYTDALDAEPSMFAPYDQTRQAAEQRTENALQALYDTLAALEEGERR